MAIPLTVSLVSLLLWLFGGNAVAYFVGGCLTLVGLGLGWRNLFGLWVVATAMYLAMSGSGTLVSDLILVIPLLLLNATGTSSIKTSTAALLSGIVAGNVVCLFMSDRQDLAHYLIPILCALLPLKLPSLPRWSVQVLDASLYLLCVFFVFKAVRAPNPIERNLVITHGAWANSTHKYSLEELNIESAYSYSELPRFLGAAHGDIAQPFHSYTQIWIVTPTAPIESSIVDKFANWVKSGGHLIVVTDHTDLYGHGRVTNELLKPYAIRALYNTTTNNHGIDIGQDVTGRNVRLKSANSFQVSSAIPFVSKLGWMEKAYYGRDNFFGPLVPSIDDIHSRHILGCSKAYGNGEVTVFGDSTMLSNFALYQPDSMRLMRMLQKRYYFAAILPWLPVAMIIAALLFKNSAKRSGSIVFLAVIISFGVIDLRLPATAWKVPSIAWSGDEACVMEGGSPSSSISTAYSIAVMSGLAPRWISHTDKESSGIWVSANRPAPNGWRWVKPTSTQDSPELPTIDAWSGLFNRVGAGFPRDWRPLFNKRGMIDAGEVWTDDVMGDWWFDRGISESRKQRFQAWLNWITEQDPPTPINVNVQYWSSTATEDWELRIPGVDSFALKGPTPLFNPTEGQEILLGRGVSVQAVIQDENLLLLGQKSKCEGLQIPPVWVLIHRAKAGKTMP